MHSYLRPLLYIYDIMVGVKAWVVQSYIEANVKNGLQFEACFDVVDLAANGTHIIAFRTTSKKAIIKARRVNFTGPKVTVRIYKGGEINETTNQSDIFNLSDVNPQDPTVELFSGATIVTAGVEFGAPTFSYGSEGVGNRSLGTFSIEGIERVLNDPELYYLAIDNNDPDTPHSFSVYLTWYEGAPDLPIVRKTI